MSITVDGLNAVDATMDGKGIRTYRVSYKSKTTAHPLSDTLELVTAAVNAATGFSLGAPWLNDAMAFCRSVKTRCLKRHDGPVPKWEWSTDYEFTSATDPDNPSGPSGEQDPTLRPPKVSVRVDRFEVPWMATVNGNPIKNSAGDPVIRMLKRGRVVFNFSRAMPTWNWEYCQEAEAASLGRLYSMNAAAWTPAGPYTALLGNTTVEATKARIENITADVSADGGGCVYVDMEVHVDLAGFNDQFIDQGFFFLNQLGVNDVGPNLPASMARRRFFDRHGFTTQPQLLDGNGRPNPVDDDPVILSYNLYHVKDWDAAPLGGVGGYFS